MNEGKAPGVHDQEERLCAVCGEEIERSYLRVGHLLSPHKLAVCEGCFDGRKTWMELKDEYFGDYVDLKGVTGSGGAGYRSGLLNFT